MGNSLQIFIEILYSLKNKNVIVFGTGEGALRATKLLTMLNISILYYIDNCKEKQESKFLGLMVNEPNTILKEDKSEVFIIVASMYYYDIYMQLEAMELREKDNYLYMPYDLNENTMINYVNRVTEINDAYSLIKKISSIPESIVTEKLIKIQNRYGSLEQDMREMILDILCEDDLLQLRNATMKFIDRKSLWVLLNEILITEDYFFETSSKKPRILDCGTNFGLAIYYFKSLYPEAEIIGFEPVKSIRDLAINNVKNNKWANVVILPYALDSCKREASFWLPKSDSMAGSLTSRRKLVGEEVEEIKVNCRPLSKYLTKPVNFLKLDIEGAELDVLIEAQQFLHMVEYIFCEVHRGNGIENNRLSRILSLLEDNGFVCQVNKSYSNSMTTKFHPIKNITRQDSSVVWGKNMKFIYNG